MANVVFDFRTFFDSVTTFYFNCTFEDVQKTRLHYYIFLTGNKYTLNVSIHIISTFLFGISSSELLVPNVTRPRCVPKSK